MKRKWKYGIHASALTAGVIAIIVLFNIFVTVLVDKFPLKLDLTVQKLYEVTDATYEYLKTYDTPTNIYILSGNADEDTNITNVLEKYEKANQYIKLEQVDMKSNPTFGQKYLSGNEQFSANTVIVDGGNRFRIYKQAELYSTSSDGTGQVYATGLNVEQKITSALKYVSSESSRKAYFVQGHNEVDMAAGQQKLQDENYETGTLNLLNENIPQDTDLLVVFNPSVDFTMAEIEKLDTYLTNGGKVQFFFYMSVNGLTRLYDYLKQWGIQVNDDVVMETERQNMIASGGIPMLIPSYAENEITLPILKAKRTAAYLPFAKSLTILFDNYNSVSVMKILETTETSYTTTDMESMEKTADSRTGRITIAAISNNLQTNGCVFVSGTPLLLEQDMEYLDSYGLANSDLYSNITKYAAGDETIISAKSFAGNALTMTAVDVLVTLIIIALIPVITIVLGIVIWFRRRHR